MAGTVRLNNGDFPEAVAKRALGHHLMAQCERLRPVAKVAPQSELQWAIAIDGTHYRVVITVERPA